MWPWTAVPPIRAEVVWRLLRPEGKARVGKWSWVCPLYARLAMGSTHSVHILMSINVRAKGTALTASSRLTPPVEEQPPAVPPVQSPEEDSDSFWYSNRLTDVRPGPQPPPVFEEGKKFYCFRLALPQGGALSLRRPVAARVAESSQSSTLLQAIYDEET